MTPIRSRRSSFVGPAPCEIGRELLQFDLLSACIHERDAADILGPGPVEFVELDPDVVLRGPVAKLGLVVTGQCHAQGRPDIRDAQARAAPSSRGRSPRASPACDVSDDSRTSVVPGTLFSTSAT